MRRAIAPGKYEDRGRVDLRDPFRDLGTLAARQRKLSGRITRSTAKTAPAVAGIPGRDA